MAQWNQTDRTLQTKVVYWGPALGGKTTNLQQIHAITDPDESNRLISLNTSSDRTLFFDLLPLDLGRIFGHTLKIQLYTVPGQVRYDATRRVVLSGADAVVFVADSQRERSSENRAAWQNLCVNMKVNGLDLATIPVIVQYNKQDLPACMSGKEIEAVLQSGKPGVPASALRGTGVMETFHVAVLDMLTRLSAPSGRRRSEDVKALETQLARTFERFQESAARHTPRPAPASGSPGDLEPGGFRSAGPGPIFVSEAMGDTYGPSAPGSTTIRMTDAAGDEELLLRSLRATLGVAEQFGEMRDVKNRLARRVSELEGLHALARSMSKRRDADSILYELAHAAMTVPGARAASVLILKADGGVAGAAAVVLGIARDPLLAQEGSSASSALVEELFQRAEPALIDTLSVPGGSARADDGGTISAAMAVPLRPTMTQQGVVILYGGAPFSSEDLRYLGLLSAHAAICLDNAAMSSRLARSNEELEAQVRARTVQLQAANEELRELDRMKDRFLSSVSHEMKTPLTAIVSGSELLSTIVADEDPSREFIALIDHQARMLSSTVDRIMRFQVFGRAKTESVAASIDPIGLAMSVIQEASGKAALREIGLATDMPAHAAQITGDAEALGLALKEILDNAVKFTPRSGIVTVSVREKLVRWTRPVAHTENGEPPARPAEGAEEVFLVFAVKDGGPGIPLEHQTRIFEKFEQLGDLLTAKPDGLGLGLPLAREVARRHGGDLFVQSEAGSGSEFRLYVPVVPHGSSVETTR